jgi:signal transduction histidine kinase
MDTSREWNTFSPRRSLRTSILLAICSSVLLMLAVWIWFGAMKIHHMSLVQLRHEGLLLSNALAAAIGDLGDRNELARVQGYIDALVAVRNQNDIEINVLRLLGDGASEIVASNDPDNVKETDEEEHQELLAALQAREATMLIDVVSDLENEQDELEASDPTHPNHYFPPGSRHLSITTPLLRDGKPLGSINVIPSLHFLDKERADLVSRCLLVLAIGGLVLAGLLVPFLNRSLFRPLNRLAREMYAFGMGETLDELLPTRRQDEIGVLQNEFYGMAARIKSAEAIREELARAKAEKKERELEAKLRQAQKMEALGTLAGGIAHDFNNILTPILGFAQLSMLKLPAESEVWKYQDQIACAALRASELVGRILTFSRRSEERRSPLQIGPVVQETLKLLRASIPANVEVREKIQENGHLVLGCPTHIHQVVLNLATNACQAMVEEGGRLDVSLEEEALSEKAVIGDGFTLGPGQYLKLTVADTGPGIRADVLERIFEPYFTTKAEGKGTGLGLAVVHGIIRDMGGAIAVGSEVGQGTTFEAYFPVTQEPPEPEGSEGCESLPTGTERLLIVDDEGPIAEMIAEMARSLGYEAKAFSDPAEALARLTESPADFDLIVSDVAMPRMTGIELVRQLSGLGVNTPVVLCSAYTGGINWRMAQAIGIQDILTKPIGRAELAKALRKVLDG